MTKKGMKYKDFYLKPLGFSDNWYIGDKRDLSQKYDLECNVNQKLLHFGEVNSNRKGITNDWEVIAKDVPERILHSFSLLYESTEHVNLDEVKKLWSTFLNILDCLHIMKLLLLTEFEFNYVTSSQFFKSME